TSHASGMPITVVKAMTSGMANTHSTTGGVYRA
ncbi:hypothetical protein A2U01_0093737, partial [Trifolium medium]|nr:hypothetical protein [Trifolium medium]